MTEWIVGGVFMVLLVAVCLAGIWWSDWQPKKPPPPPPVRKNIVVEDPRYVKSEEWP